MSDSGKLNILVVCDNPLFQTGLEDLAKGSQLNFVFTATIEKARVEKSGNDIRLLLLPMSLNGRDTLWFARELKRTLIKRFVVALYPMKEFKNEFAGEVLAAWPQDPLRVYAELKKLCGLYL